MKSSKRPKLGSMETDEVERSCSLESEFKTYSDQRQIGKFHSWYFDLVSSPDLPIDLSHLQNFQSIYGRTIIKVTPVQAIQTWKLFLAQDPLNPMVAELFIYFLDHFRIGDDSTPKAVLVQEVECLKETRDLISGISFAELTELEQLVQILRLIYSWGNLVILRNAFDGEVALTEWTKYSWYDLGPIHDYNDAELWKVIVQQCFKGDAKLTEIILKLMNQKLFNLYKALYTSKDLTRRQICTSNIETSVSHILTKITKRPELLRQLDLWRFSSFVPSNQIHRLTDLIVKGVSVSGDDESERFLVATRKGCEKKIFVSSIIDSAINNFTETLDVNSRLRGLYSHPSFQAEYFEESEGKLLFKVVDYEFEEMVHEILGSDESVTLSPDAIRILSIFDSLPLEYLQTETQLRYTLFMIPLAFSVGLFTSLGARIVNLVSPIFKSHEIWLLRLCSAKIFFSALFNQLRKRRSVPDHLIDLITVLLKKLSPSYSAWEPVSVIQTVSSIILNCKYCKTMRILLVLLLERLISNEMYLNDPEIPVTNLVSRLIQILNETETNEELSLDEMTDSLQVLSLFFENKKPLEKKEKTLFKSFVALRSRTISETFKSILAPIDDEGRIADLFKSKTKFLLFLSSPSAHQTCELSSSQLTLLWQYIFPNYPSVTDDSLNLSLNREQDNGLMETISVLSSFIFNNIEENLRKEYLSHCLNILKSSKSSVSTKTFSLQVIKGLVNKKWTGLGQERSLFFDSQLDKILDRISKTMAKQNSSSKLSIQLIDQCCQLTKDILSINKSLLTTPRLHYCLQVASLVPLHRLTDSPSDFTVALSSYYTVVNQFLLKHSNMITTCMVILKEMLQTYLSKLIEVSDQIHFNSYNQTIQEDLSSGALNLYKLICQLANGSPKALAPISPFLITQYIHLNHSYTIAGPIKSHLILCIYKLLNVIKSNSDWQNIYDMIHCRLNQSGRDLLKTLHENYEKFYVFKGRF